MATRTPRSSDHRFARWRRRLADTDPTHPSQATNKVLRRQLEDSGQHIPQTCQVAFDEIWQAEAEVRAVLNAAGVPTISYPSYLNFGRQLWKLTGRIGGLSAFSEFLALRDKWASRGLTEGVLEQIRSVFGISTSPPQKPVLSAPPNESTNQPIAGTLAWLKAKWATGYDVFLGLVVIPYEKPPKLSSNQPGLTYAYAGLEYNSDYNWLITAKNKYGDSAESTLWTFHTVTE